MVAPSDEIRVGDLVNVPGGMYGTVKFLGTVNGKPGRFAGIELASEHASRGKNNGDVDGRSYFTTSVPGAGIFVPMNNSKYVTRRVPVTPPTPSRATAATPNFSKSLGPASMSMPRPRLRRPSLPRPESPRASQSPPKSSMTGLRTPSTTLKSSINGPLTNGPNRALFPKTPSRLSDRPPSRVSAGDETPTSAKTSDTFESSALEPHDLKEKVRALERELKDRDRQLEEQTKALNELQESVSQLEVGDINTMRAQLREKNEKIAQLTADFDVHRADFRSTLDTLEVAASETERVYEKRLDELMQQIRELQDRGEDVETVARQLKQLEELVSELEEGLEDARRGEAEARGEVEFLRGEVERAHLELKQEREKSAAALKDAETRRNTKELDQKDDEIRGLKAIIHSLSRGESSPAHHNAVSPSKHQDQSAEKISKLEQRIQELEGAVDSRSKRVEELQKELLRAQSNQTPGHTRSGTVTVAPLRHHKANGSGGRVDSTNPISHVHTLSDRTVVPQNWQEIDEEPPALHGRNTVDAAADVDNQSSDTASLWCEICETKGHDILTCTTFGNGGLDKQNVPRQNDQSRSHITNGHAANAFDDRTTSPTQPASNGHQAFGGSPSQSQRTGRDAVLEGLKGIGSLTSSMAPVAGKASGVIDETKWCALCERDGHESIDCPFED